MLPLAAVVYLHHLPLPKNHLIQGVHLALHFFKK
jgi:hypothetical protein